VRLEVRINVGIIRNFVFLCGIRFAMTCHGFSPRLGDFLADHFGMTAAYQRGHRLLSETGKPN
jgi:hypothetical protein